MRSTLGTLRRRCRWIIAVLMVAGALYYLHVTGDLSANMIVATTLGVFFPVLLGCGLFAAAFLSSKSGIDQDVTDATKRERDRR